MDEATLHARMLARKSTVTPLVGQLVEASASGFVVDVGGGRIPARCATNLVPAINDPVNVVFIDGVPFVIGPTTPVADRGTVVSVAGGLVTVTTAFGDLEIPYNVALAPTAGQVLHLIGKYADSVMSTSPAGGTPPPPPPSGGSATHVDTFPAIDAGSYGYGSWQRTEVWASDHYQGAAFYGSKIPDTLPASAVIQRVQFYVSAKQIQGNPPNFALHTYQSKPGGPPTLTSDTPIGIVPGWENDLPLSFGNAMRAGGGSFGVGVDHGGYSILRSLAEDSLSCALMITSVY